MKNGLVLILVMVVLVLSGCENKAQKQELEAANAKIVDLVAQLDVLQAERDDLKIDIAAKADALSQIKDKVSMLDSVEKGKAVLQQQYDNLKQSSADTVNKLKEWQTKAKNYLSQIDTLTSANQKLKDMIKALREKTGGIELPVIP